MARQKISAPTAKHEIIRASAMRIDNKTTHPTHLGVMVLLTQNSLAHRHFDASEVT
jgi:hypothetical protein